MRSLRLLIAGIIFVCAASAIVGDGSKTVAVAGTREPLTATSVPVVWVTVQCAVDNTGNCFVGGSSIADGRGVELSPGEAHTFPTMGARQNFYNLDWIFVDVQTSGDSVSFIYFKR